jgi:replicative DNA helicase
MSGPAASKQQVMEIAMQKVIEPKPSVNSSVKLPSHVAENVLAVLCLSKEHGQSVSARVEPNNFDEEAFRTIATYALDYWKKYKEPPGDVHIGDLIAPILTGKKQARADRFRAIWHALLWTKHQGFNAEFVLDQVTTLQRLSELSRTTLQAADLIEAHQEHAIEDVEKLFADTARARPSNLVEGLWGSDVQALVAHINRRADHEFETGIPELDRCGVVPTRRTLMTMLAPFGVGKSWFLVHVARCALYTRRKVLFVTLEMDQAEVMQRFYQSLGVLALRAPELEVTLSRMVLENERLAGFADHEFRAHSYLQNNPRLAAVLQDVHDARKQFLRALRIDDFAALTVAQLEAHLDRLESMFGFVPDLLCLDYLGKLDTAGKEDYRIELGQQTSALVTLMKERNIAGVTAQQVNREGQTAKRVNRTHIAEDISIGGTSDFILTLSRNDKERLHGLARIWVDKARHAVDNFGVVIGQNLHHGQFVRKDPAAAARRDDDDRPVRIIQSAPLAPSYEEQLSQLAETRG